MENNGLADGRTDNRFDFSNRITTTLHRKMCFRCFIYSYLPSIVGSPFLCSNFNYLYLITAAVFLCNLFMLLDNFLRMESCFDSGPRIKLIDANPSLADIFTFICLIHFAFRFGLFVVSCLSAISSVAANKQNNHFNVNRIGPEKRIERCLSNGYINREWVKHINCNNIKYWSMYFQRNFYFFHSGSEKKLVCILPVLLLILNWL